MIPMYSTKKFTDYFGTVDEFITEYNEAAIPTTISEVSARTLYYLLYSKYGNNPIANYDETQFKYKIWATIFQFGPTWEKRLEIQTRLRNMSEKEMMSGAKSIYNTALNPDQTPDTSQTDELSYVSNQNVNKQTKSVLGAYAELWNMLRIDVTREFLDKFKDLFRTVVMPDHTNIYVTYEEE